jgi:hypothetical protein
MHEALLWIRIRGSVPLTNGRIRILLFSSLSFKTFKIKSHKEVTKSRNQGFSYYFSVLRIRIRIRIHMFLGLPDPDPLVRGMDPDPDPALDPDPSIIMQK